MPVLLFSKALVAKTQNFSFVSLMLNLVKANPREMIPPTLGSVSAAVDFDMHGEEV
jgi:hypothetical protein